MTKPFFLIFVFFGTVDPLRAETSSETAWPAELLGLISLSNIFWTLVLLAIGYVVIRLVVKLLEMAAERITRFRITLKSLIPVARIVIWTSVIALIIKGVFDPPLEMLLTAGASIAIAVGLAIQDLLKNVVGGIILLFDRPFQVGDKIELSNHYGEVKEIGLLTTRIVTPDDSIVSIPNMELMNSPVSNSNSGALDCQVVTEIFLPMDVDTWKVRKIAVEAALTSRFIFLNKPVTVLFFNEMHERKSLLKMKLKAYVLDIRYEFQFKSDMTESVLKELLNQGLVQTTARGDRIHESHTEPWADPHL